MPKSAMVRQVAFVARDTDALIGVERLSVSGDGRDLIRPFAAAAV